MYIGTLLVLFLTAISLTDNRKGQNFIAKRLLRYKNRYKKWRLTYMKILVCGGRNFMDITLMNKVLREYPIGTIIEGGAKGADTLAYLWGNKHDVEVITYPPEWNKYGKAAGPIRNQTMLDQESPDLVIAFPGGRGTEDMIARAKKANIPTRVVKLEEKED